MKQLRSQPFASMIYFIQEGRTGPIKVGFTRHMRMRIDDLQMGNFRPLRLLGVMDGSRHQEQDIHKTFAAAQLRGEWFKPVDALRRYIRQYAMHWDEARHGTLGPIQRGEAIDTRMGSMLDIQEGSSPAHESALDIFLRNS